MNGYEFIFCGAQCIALASGSLFLPNLGLLCVSDLHLGKSERIARRGGTMLPPYEVQETLQKLQEDITISQPDTVICLGDSFDDTTSAQHLHADMRLWLAGLQAGRNWIWIEGNHDPGPVEIGGAHRQNYRIDHLVFRHIATPEKGEISGHYHPKHRLAGRTKPAFIVDKRRIIMPAYGAYTGGLNTQSPDLRKLFTGPTRAIMTGHKAIPVPL